MTKTVTEEMVDRRIDVVDVQTVTLCGKKVTLVAARLTNGFVLVETSTCVDPANYDESIGAEVCIKRIRERIWELEGYLLSERIKNGKA